MAKRWKKEELTYLKRYAANRKLATLAERFKTDSDTVAAQLESMGLAAEDSVAPIKLENDPLVKVYEKGVKALQRGDKATARRELQKVLDETDRPQLAARARQFLRLLGEPDEAAEADDPFLEAVYRRNRGDVEEALAICARGGRQSKDERFAYLAAGLHALRGDAESALRFLGLAVELNPKNRIHAHFDADFDGLRDEPEFARLLGAG